MKTTMRWLVLFAAALAIPAAANPGTPAPAPAKPAAAPAAKPATTTATTTTAKPVTPAPKPAGTGWIQLSGVGGKGFTAKGVATLRAKARYMPRGTSTMGTLPAGSGQLRPIADVVSLVRADLNAAKQMPGDPWVHDYDAWSATPAAARPAIAPGELNDKEKADFAAQYGPIIDDLKDYVPFLWDIVDGLKGLPLPDQVDLLYQYGCRRISHAMPGYARIIVKKIVISESVNLVGDWNQVIPPSALPAASAKPTTGTTPAGPGVKNVDYKPKEEIVEICTVTHRQVEETLKKDLAAMAVSVRPGTAAAKGVEFLNPVSGLAFTPINGPAARTPSPAPSPDSINVTLAASKVVALRPTMFIAPVAVAAAAPMIAAPATAPATAPVTPPVTTPAKPGTPAPAPAPAPAKPGTPAPAPAPAPAKPGTPAPAPAPAPAKPGTPAPAPAPAPAKPRTPAPAPAPAPKPIDANTDRPGGDFLTVTPAPATAELCRTACLNNATCKAYSYVLATKLCKLKNTTPAPQTGRTGISSGVK